MFNSFLTKFFINNAYNIIQGSEYLRMNLSTSEGRFRGMKVCWAPPELSDYEKIAMYFCCKKILGLSVWLINLIPLNKCILPILGLVGFSVGKLSFGELHIYNSQRKKVSMIKQI